MAWLGFRLGRDKESNALTLIICSFRNQGCYKSVEEKHKLFGVVLCYQKPTSEWR